MTSEIKKKGVSSIFHNSCFENVQKNHYKVAPSAKSHSRKERNLQTGIFIFPAKRNKEVMDKIMGYIFVAIFYLRISCKSSSYSKNWGEISKWQV